MTSPDIAPAGTGPTCTLCGIQAGPDVWLGHWQRRLTSDEISIEQAKEQARRDQILALADPQLPPPEFGPMPDMLDYTTVVYGCKDHAIKASAAALIHAADCTAPTAADLPGCNCTPEPLPQPDPDPAQPELPPGW